MGKSHKSVDVIYTKSMFFKFWFGGGVWEGGAAARHPRPFGCAPGPIFKLRFYGNIRRSIVGIVARLIAGHPKTRHSIAGRKKIFLVSKSSRVAKWPTEPLI
jgi:hypothetical protein